MSSHRDPEEQRAEILARRARIQAETEQLLPEQRLHRGVVYGPLYQGQLRELRAGDLLELTTRYRYDEVVEMAGAKRGARTRLTVLFSGGWGFTARWNMPISFRRPLPSEARCSECGAPFYRGLTQDGQTELCPSCHSYAEASQ
jgi:hypothetical protein